MRKFALIAAFVAISIPAMALPTAPATPPLPVAAPATPTSLKPPSPATPAIGIAQTVVVTAPAKPLTAVAPAAPIDLNFAKADELQALTGIGPARAKAIVDGRPYGAPQDIVTKGIVPQSAFDAIKARISVATVNINTATVAELVDRLPGIGDVRANAIVKKRPFKAADELVSKGIITQAIFDGLKGIATVR